MIRPELELRQVTLRDFTFSLKPLVAVWGEVTGVELEAVAKDTGLKVSLRFDRSEFVNLATAGLAGLDAADEVTGGGD